MHEVTRIRFNDAGPLIGLGRLAEAGRLLRECQRVFEDHADTPMLATVLTTRADLEDDVRAPAGGGGPGSGPRCGSVYARPEPQDIAISHHNLANYLGRLGGDRAGQRAHRLAAALICRLAGMAHDLAGTVRALAAELRADDGGAGLPSTVAEVVAVAELTEGVRLGALLAALQPDPGRRRGRPGGDPRRRPNWRPMMVSLLDGLDPIDTAIARETLVRLGLEGTTQRD